MQFTLEQYAPLLALTAAVIVFGSFSYRCGLYDKNQRIKEAQRLQSNAENHALILRHDLGWLESNAATSAQAIELLNDELEAANLIKSRQIESILQAEDVAEAYSELTVHLKNEIDALKLLALSDSQRKTIRQAASQLLLTSQIMGAINNKESAKTQSTLATRLHSILIETHETLDPACDAEAA